MVDEIKQKTELEKLHDRLVILEKKAKPIAEHAYLEFKAFLVEKINKYPTKAAWMSGILGAVLMYTIRSWLSF